MAILRPKRGKSTMSSPTDARSWKQPALRLIIVLVVTGVASQALFAGGGHELETREALSAGGNGSGEGIIPVEPFQGQRVVRFRADAREIVSIALSPDGKWAASADDKVALRIWHVPTHRLVVTRRVFENSNMGRVRFSPDGRSLLVGSRDSAQMLAVGTWLTRWSAETYSVSHQDIAFSRDSEIIAIPVRNDDGASVELRDVETGDVIKQLDMVLDWIEVVLLGPHGDRIFVAGYNNSTGTAPVTRLARLWNWKTGREHLRMDSLVKSAAWDTKRGRLYVFNGGHRINEYDVRSGRKLRFWHLESDASCRSIALANDGRLMILGLEDAVELWDAYGAKRLDRVLMPKRNLSELSPRDDGRFVLVADWYAGMFWGIRFPLSSGDERSDDPADPATEAVDDSSSQPGKLETQLQQIEERVSHLEQDNLSDLADLKTAINELSGQLERLEASPASLAESKPAARSPRIKLPRGGIVPFEIDEFARHDYSMTRMVLSPNDRWIATTTRGGPVYVWDVRGGPPLAKIDVSELKRHFGVAFSPDGESLAVAGTKGIKILSTEDWTPQWTKSVSELHPGTYVRVAFSQDGKRLALVGKFRLKIWDVETRELLHSSEHEFLGISTLRFNDTSDEIMLVGSSSLPGGGSEVIQIWNWEDNYRRTLGAYGPRDIFQGVAWDVERSKLYALLKNGIEQRNTHSGLKIREWPGTAEISEIALSGDGRFLAAGTGFGTVDLWETSSMQRVESLPVGLPYVDFLALSSDGTHFYAAVRGDYTIRRGTFRMPSQLAPEEIDSLSQKQTLRESLVDHRVFNVAPDRKIAGPSSSIISFAMAPDGETAFMYTLRHGLEHWDLRSGMSLLDPLRPQPNRLLREITCLPNGERLAFIDTRRREIVLWDVKSWKPIKTIGGDRHGAPFNLAVSPDGKIGAVGEGSSIVIWNLATGQRIREIPVGAMLWNLSMSSDKHYLAGISRDALRVWSAKTGDQLFEIRPFGHKRLPWNGLSFSPTTPVRLLVSGEGISWRSLDHWNLGRPVKSLRGRDEGFGLAVYSPDSTLILGVGSERAYVFDAENFEELVSVPCAQSTAKVAQFTPDGSHFLTIDKRGRFVFWPVPGKKQAADSREAPRPPSTPQAPPNTES